MLSRLNDFVWSDLWYMQKQLHVCFSKKKTFSSLKMYLQFWHV